MSLLERVRTAAGSALGTPSPRPAKVDAPSATGFDHVEWPSDDGSGARTRLSKIEFDALPLQKRIGLLVQGTLRFYRADREVPPSDAMRAAY
jgi:hypothetical protein